MAANLEITDFGLFENKSVCATQKMTSQSNVMGGNPKMMIPYIRGGGSRKGKISLMLYMNSP